MTNFKGADAKPLSAVCIGLHSMTDADWSNYVLHVTGAGELFMQYGCEPTEEWIACIQTMTPDVVYYAVYLNEENVMAGYVGVTPETGNLEFYIFREFRKRGIGTDAVRLLIRLWFSGGITGERETKIEAETLSQNLASVRLLEKLGFQKEAVGLRMIPAEEDAHGSAIGLCAYSLKKDACEV